MKIWTTIFSSCMGMLLFMLLWVCLLGWVTSLLWNWLVPDLFNGPEITTLQAMGLMVLIGLLLPKVNINTKN